MGKSRPEDQLTDLLRAATDQVARDAVQGSGSISAEQFEHLERLARTVEFRRMAQPKPRPNRWFLGLIGLTFAIVGVLLFVPVGETEIVIEVRLEEVAFRLAGDDGADDPATLRQTLLRRGTNVRMLGVSGAQHVRVRGDRDDQWPPEGSHVRLRTRDVDQPSHVTLSDVVLPAGSFIAIDPPAAAGAFTLTLGDADIEIRADMIGSVEMTAMGAGSREETFSRPRAATFHTAGDHIQLDVEVQDLSAVRFAPSIEISAISFYGSRFGRSYTSSILSGAVYLEELDGEVLELRRGQELRMDSFTGSIRALRLEPDSIELQLQGRVRGLETGSHGTPRSLMPTWLEWLASRHGLSLFWGTAFYVVGLIAAALRWFRLASA